MLSTSTLLRAQHSYPELAYDEVTTRKLLSAQKQRVRVLTDEITCLMIQLSHNKNIQK